MAPERCLEVSLEVFSGCTFALWASLARSEGLLPLECFHSDRLFRSHSQGLDTLKKRKARGARVQCHVDAGQIEATEYLD